MNTIAQIIEKEEVLRRNQLRKHCTDGITIAIKIMTKLNACIFIRNLFSYKLGRCMAIWQYIQNGDTFLEAEFKTEIPTKNG